MVNMTIPGALRIFTNAAKKIEDEIFNTILYQIALRTAVRYNSIAFNMNPIDISSMITGTKDWFFRQRAMYAPSVKTDYLEKEFKSETDQAIIDLNGWLAYCKINEDNILCFISMGDEEKYTLPAIEMFLYGDEKSPQYQFYTRVGKEKGYLYFN